jgi:hypothetical protein
MVAGIQTYAQGSATLAGAVFLEPIFLEAGQNYWIGVAAINGGTMFGWAQSEINLLRATSNDLTSSGGWNGGGLLIAPYFRLSTAPVNTVPDNLPSGLTAMIFPILFALHRLTRPAIRA